VLRRPIGGPEVMAEQLDQLADAALLPNVSIRVVPFSAGLHRGMLSGPFAILRFPVNGDGQESEPPVVYVTDLGERSTWNGPARSTATRTSTPPSRR